MASRSHFNAKSPTIKRILKEAAELSASPSAEYHAAPLETNIFEWHFTLRGPPAPSPYAEGAYHGRIVLPPTYPLRPPSFRFLTPSGRFEVNREICLSISGHHEETWQPAWGVRTALVALRAFMDGEAKGQVGGVEASRDVRIRLAQESGSWQCSSCGAKKNREVIAEVGEEAQRCEAKGALSKAVIVPEELRIGYREEIIGGVADPNASSGLEDSVSPSMPSQARGALEHRAHVAQGSSNQPSSSHIDLRAPNNHEARFEAPRAAFLNRNWIDLAIYGIATALILMLARKVLYVG